MQWSVSATSTSHAACSPARSGRGWVTRSCRKLPAGIERFRRPVRKPSAAASGDGLTADQLANHYDMTPLYSLGDFGQGVNVALVEFESEPTVTADVAVYQACYGTDATVNYLSVDSGPENVLSDPTGLETALDIEDVIGLAPEASVDVYQGPFDTDQEALDMYGAIINADTDQIVSTSWGECELDSDSSLIDSEQPLFEQAAAQGQAVFAAGGDDGSTDCYADVDTTNGSTPAVDDPGSQPNVVDVGSLLFSATPRPYGTTPPAPMVPAAGECPATGVCPTTRTRRRWWALSALIR